MFEVANTIAYDGLMVYGTQLGNDEADKSWLGESRWIDVSATGSDGHWVPAQGRLAIELVRQTLEAEGGLFDKEGKARIFVISPFKAVARQIREALYGIVRTDNKKIAGTVHTFQGKEADVVVLLLGGDPKRPGALDWAADQPNILNVAVTRARRRLYVIGDRAAWQRGHFRTLIKQLDALSREKLEV